ncbi:hypothetical protein RclHR1_02480006 [Rhizophagus clarus]|uniref:Kinase-like domain-containing protein n=1 Tax=Rhizophagus clarus TaxID=94130 RepID=A0A2Z6QXY7_9GLOM|nr:hypothetical protein RclHR1_02480006 [Rhizophagus clarus]GET02855.1 kinase-like domain-containing protein [Rhizophagus clarus]
MMIEWINSAIVNRHIQLYPYNEFHNIEYNNESSFSRVDSADWPLTNRKVALKKLKNFNVEKFVSEVRMHIICHSSIYIIRFLGLTREEGIGTSYIMILEYADQNLRMFLQKYTNFEWDGKLKISLDIAKGLGYLHSLNIAHRDLHSNNIVINQVHNCTQSEFIARITDFGSATVLSDDNNDNDKVLGQIPFTDPKYLNDHRYYRKDLRSDIYSLGVVFWEISSNTAPFMNFMGEFTGDYRDLCLAMAIIAGLRENRKVLTPDEYYMLYKRCWDDEPSERPNINAVIETLKTITIALVKTITIGNDDYVSTYEETKYNINKSINKGYVKKDDSESASQSNIYKSENKITYDIKTKENEDEVDVTKIEFKLFNKDQITDITDIQYYNSNNNINLRLMSTDNSKIVIKKLYSDKIKPSNLNNLYKISEQSNNIVKFLGIFKDKDKFFLVTPFSHEGNLRDYLSNKNCPSEEKIKIATDIVHGILFLHKEHDIIHENLHPKNIIMFDGIAKISDLPLPYEKKSICLDEHFFEKIGYLDPDSLLNKRFKKAKSMDIYSLGSLLWEMISEQIPYSKDTRVKSIIKLIKEIKKGHREVDVPNLPDIPAECMNEYKDLYNKCWDKDSSSRPIIEDVHKKILHINTLL